jgi:hypothetical protein
MDGGIFGFPIGWNVILGELMVVLGTWYAWRIEVRGDSYVIKYQYPTPSVAFIFSKKQRWHGLSPYLAIVRLVLLNGSERNSALYSLKDA